MTQVADNTQHYVRAFERSEERRSLAEPESVRRIRRAAIEAFVQGGFPTTRDEDWRYTSVAPIAEARFSQQAERPDALTATELRRLCGGAPPAARLVFVNGRYAPELSQTGSLPRGMRAISLSHALDEHGELVEPYLARYARADRSHAFVALNTALMADGAVLIVPRGMVVEEPVQLLFVSSAPGGPFASHPRTLVVAGENSQVTVVERYLGLDPGAYFTNAVTEIAVAEGAAVDHCRVIQEGAGAYHVSAVEAHLGRSAGLSAQSVSLGGSLVRNGVAAVLGGEGAHCTLDGLVVAAGRQHIDNHTFIDHAMPHCTSHELYKNVLDDHARGVFNGKILVRQDAQKTDARQTNQAVMLSREAVMDTRPQLEIYADDVKCTHGATVGNLDETALFYLRSRGIGLDDARSLLVYAFAHDIVGRIRVEPVRQHLASVLLRRLPGE